MQKIMKGQSRLSVGNGIGKAVMAISTEDRALELEAKIRTYEQKHGCYTDAHFDRATQKVASFKNPVLNEALGRYCTAGV